MNHTTALGIIMLVGAFAMLRGLLDVHKNKTAVLWNLLLGGMAFVLVNLLGFHMNLNLMTGGLVTLYGIPGVALIVVLKLIFKII